MTVIQIAHTTHDGVSLNAHRNISRNIRPHFSPSILTYWSARPSRNLCLSRSATSRRKSAINPLIGAIQHRPDTQPATAAWRQQSVKHYAIFSSLIWRGALVNCTHSWFHPPLPPSVCAGRIYRGASFENHPRCHSSPFLRRGPDRSVFFTALSQRPPKPFICRQRFLSPPALCFNSEKQAGAHLSALPYLLPRRVFSGTSILVGLLGWVGGKFVAGGWGGGWESTVMPSPIILEGIHGRQQILWGSRDCARCFYFYFLFFFSLVRMQQHILWHNNAKRFDPLLQQKTRAGVEPAFKGYRCLPTAPNHRQTNRNPRREPIPTHAVLRSKPLILTSSPQEKKKKKAFHRTPRLGENMRDLWRRSSSVTKEMLLACSAVGSAAATPCQLTSAWDAHVASHHAIAVRTY